MIFSTWNVMSLCRAGSLTAAARYKLDLVSVQEVGLDKGGMLRAGIIIFAMEQERKSSIGNRIFVHRRIVLAVRRLEFVSDSVSYVMFRGRWCNITVLDVHAQSDKSDDPKDSFYEYLE